MMFGRAQHIMQLVQTFRLGLGGVQRETKSLTNLEPRAVHSQILITLVVVGALVVVVVQ